jgi:hypothetical protein
MSKTIDTLINTRRWIRHIDDERSIGNSLIVTLERGWHFNDGDREGVRGYDTLTELKADTKRDNVTQKFIVLR